MIVIILFFSAFILSPILSTSTLVFSGKVLTSKILQRIKQAAEDVLCQEQAGFKKGRLCSDHIFTPRQIIEKAEATNTTTIIINVINFHKAFDSVHRSTVWKKLHIYGVPEKIINIIKMFCQGSRCAVRHDGKLNEWFQVVTRVRQGCILSPLIFLLVMDYVMHRATNGCNIGIKWTCN